MMLFSLLLFSKLNAQVTQTICLEDAIPKSYKVDWEENGGEGTIGSTYTWEILEGSYNALIQPTSTSGNQIEIDWSTVPVGTYTLVVTETTQAGCFNQEELEVVLENCDCDTPVTVNIDDIEPICEGQTIQLSVEIINASTVQWSTDGDGSFDNNTSFTPIYTPGVTDIANGNVMLYVVTEDPDGVCDAGNASVELIINSLSQVDMSSVEVHHCLRSSFELPTSVDGVSGTWQDEEGEIVTQLNTSTIDDDLIYTFIPDDDQGCYADSTVSFVIEALMDLSFEGLPEEDICDVADLPMVESLPNSSEQGVAGAWTQEDNQDGTYTYTFTPTDICYNEYSFTVTLTEAVDTEFVYSDSFVCDAAELPLVDDLAIQDNNGVDGTWTVAQTGDDYTYTFTPSGGCYNEFTFVVTVTSSVDAVFNYTDSSVCDTAELPELSTLDSQDNNGVDGTWTVAQTGDVYTYTFTPSGGCYNEFTFVVSVTSSVDTAFNYTDSSVCDIAELPLLDDLATQDNNGVAGTWTVSQVGDVYTFTFTPIDPCYNEFSFVITVTDSVDTEFTYVDSTICDAAELPDVSTLAPQDNNGVAGTWTVTQTGDDYTYTFTPSGGCYNEFTFVVTVISSVDTEFNYTDSSICDTAELPELSTLDSQDNNGVDGTWTVNQVDDVYTYTFMPIGDCYNEFTFTVTVTDSVATIFDYTDLSVCDVTEIPEVSTLAPQDNNGVAGTWTVSQVGNVYTYTFTPIDPCYNEFSFVITVTDSVDTEFTYVDSTICDVAELPELGDLATQDNNGVDGAWSVSQVDDVYTYTFMPTGGCFNEFSFTVTVSDLVDMVFDYTDSSVCDAAEIPEVGELATQDNNGVDGTWTVAQTGDDYSYTFTPSGGCYNEFTFIITVTSSVDTAFNYTDSSVCDAAEIPEVGELATQDNNGVDGTWAVNQVDDVYTYTFTPIDTCYNEFSFTVTVSDSVDTVFTYTDSAVCDAAELPEVSTLDPQDNNGVAGTWTVNQIDDVYTYTFTPTGDCYYEFSFVVTMTDSVDTEFTYVDSTICDAAELPELGDLDSQDNNGVDGTWAVIQTGDDYTYTFMPSGACYNEFIFTVTVTSSVDTVFDYTDSSVCDAAELPELGDLATQDNNGVDGTWAVIQTGDDYTYTFTATDTCYNEFSFIVTISGSVDTEFTYVDSTICDASELPELGDLATQDNNGVDGAWSVSQVDDVYTYTFTPTGDCYNEFTFTVTVTDSVATIFDYTDLSVCDVTEIPEVSTLAPQDNNGVDGTWSVNQVGDVYTYTFTPIDPCYNEFSFVLTVTASVDTVFDYTDSSVCDAAELPELGDLATQDNNGVDGTWAVIQTGDDYTYTFTATDTCYNEFSFIVTISGSVDTEFTYVDSTICDASELPELGDLATQDNNGVDGAWSVSQVDDVYTYTFTPTGDCYNEFSFVITVTDSVDAEFAYTDSSVCDASELPELGDLAAQDNNGVAGTWAVIQTGDDYTYTFTPTGGCFNEFSFTVTVTSSVDTEFTYTDSSVCDAADLPEVSTLDSQDNNGVEGTWTVVQTGDDNAYTFTPSGGCYNEFTFIITVTSSVDTVFTYVDSTICDVAELPELGDLATQDNNDVDGTWSVEQVDDVYTYTFAPIDTCYNEFSFIVTISGSVETVFTYVDSTICDASELPELGDLATQDNNGVAGTWTVNQIDDVYTYTFTPIGDCYNEFTFTVTVTDSVATIFDYTDLSVCDVAEIPEVSTLAPQDNNGVDGTWTVSQVDDVYTYTFTPTGDCYNEFTFTVTVTDSVATIFDYTDLSVCDVTEIPEVSTLAPQDNNGVDGSWTVSQVGDVYTFTFTPIDPCYNEFSFVITVTDSVDTEFTYVDSTICDVAEIPELGDLATQDNNGVAGTWSVSQIDDDYSYTFTATDTCYNEFSFIVTISGSVDTEFTYVDSTICDASELPELGDLATQDINGVAGTWTVIQTGDDYTYTFTPTGGCFNEFSFTVTVSDLVDTVFTYVDSTICDAAELPELGDLATQDNNGVDGTWAVAQAGDVYTYTFMPTGGCFNEFSFTVTITDSVDTVFDYTNSSVCDVAELPVVEDLASQDNSGVDGTWTLNQVDDVYTYTFTPIGDCYNEFSFTVTITDPVDTEFAYTDSSVCDAAELPDVSTLASQDNNGVEGTWTVNQVDDVYTYTFTPTGDCYNEYSFVVTVTDSVDTEFAYTDSSICDAAELPEVSILASQDNNGVDGTWSVNQADEVYTYTFTPTGDCYNEFSFVVTVTDSVDTEFTYVDSTICDVAEIPDVSTLASQDDNGVDGTWTVSQVDNVYTYTFTPTDSCYNEFTFTVIITSSVDTVFDYTNSSVCDAAELPEVSTLASQDDNGVDGTWTVNQVDDVYTYTFTPIGGCYNEFSFDISVVDYQEVSFNNLPTSSVCDTADLPRLTDLPRISIEGTTGTWTQTNNGNQTYTYEFILDENQGCFVGTSFTVQITDNITPEFSFEHTYCQNSSPSSLPQTSDNGITGQWLPAVINTAFTNMRLYTFVPHEGQCASSVDVMIEIIDCPEGDTELNIPNVITPNNDGMNDTWFVDGLIEAYPSAELEIYNRYNKLLYQGIGAENCEWNGTYAGSSLPSGNYWYVLRLADGKVKTGHITIIYP